MQTLVEEGACVRIEGEGIIIPTRHLMTAKIATQRSEAMVAFNQLISDLNTINFDFDAVPVKRPAVAVAPGARPEGLPVMLISGMINGYILRVLEDSVRTHGDFPTAVIFAMIIALNTRHFTFDPELAWKFATIDQAPPDALRRPANKRQIAAELRMPPATVRRKILDLETKGMCQIQGKGVIVQNEAMARPDFVARGLNMHQWLVSTLGELTALGLDFRHWPPADAELSA